MAIHVLAPRAGALLLLVPAAVAALSSGKIAAAVFACSGVLVATVTGSVSALEAAFLSLGGAVIVLLAPVRLREHDRLPQIVGEAALPMMLHADDGEVLAVSRTWTELSGYSSSDLPTVAAWIDRAHRSQAEHARSALGPDGDGQYAIRTASGAERVWRLSSSSAGEDGGGRKLILTVAADVTDQERAEQDVRETHARLDATLGSITDGLIILDREWRTTYLNESGAQLLGLAPEKLVGNNLWEVFPEAVGRKFHTEYHRAVESGQPAHFEEFYPAPLDLWLECHAYPSAEGLSVYFHDVTARKQAEFALQQRTAELDSLLANAPIGLAFFDRAHRYIRINEQLAEINGIPQADHIGRTVHELLPVNAVTVDPLLERVFATAEPVRAEVVGETPREPGRTRYWLSGFYPVFDRDGGVMLVGVFVVEISDAKRAEQELRQANERLRLALDSARMGLFDIEVATDTVVWDDRSPVLFGFHAGDTWSLPEIYERIHEADRETVQANIAKACDPSGNGIYDAEYRVLWPDGSVHWIVSTGRVYFSDEGAERKAVRLFGINQDVTERKHIELALRESEERFRTLAETMPHLVWEMSPLGAVTYANREWRKYYGHDAVRPEQWVEVVHPDDAHLVARAWTELQAIGVTDQYLARLRRHDGAWRWFAIRTSPVYDGNGRLTQWVGTASDVHAQRVAEAALREREARFRSMIDSIPQLAWMTEKDGYIFWYNRRWYDYTGTTFEQMKGWGWRTVHHEDHVQRVEDRFRHSLETGEPWEDTFPLRGKNGEWRWFLSRALPIRDDAGEIVTWFGTNTDITEQLEAEAALRESELHFRQLAEAVPGIVWTADATGAVAYFNSRFYTYAGQTEEEAMLWGWQAVVHADDLPRCVERWRRSIDTGCEYEVEYRFRRHDGLYRWFLGRGSPLRDAAGKIHRWFGTATDIHEQKNVEEALRRSNEDLQQFAYVASHDLQEPLRTIVLFSQMLERRYAESLDPAATEYLTYVKEAGSRMSTLISDLLTYSRATTERDRITAIVSLEDLLMDVLRSVKVLIDETGATVRHSGLPAVYGDPAQLRQVFQNLIVNALKYRRPGVAPEVEIGVRRNGGEWLVWVRDNGVGFAQEFSERIFGIFKRLHGREVPGTGIGLAICKTVIERHGGRIWAESEIGQGATFFLTLPAIDGASMGERRH